jgi:DNA-binding CsgD family transcriptional regulator
VRLAALVYGLTAAETHLVRALIAGKTPEEVSEERSVSLATVKTQLRSVFSKTGTRRQSDLIRALFSIAR